MCVYVCVCLSVCLHNKSKINSSLVQNFVIIVVVHQPNYRILMPICLGVCVHDHSKNRSVSLKLKNSGVYDYDDYENSLNKFEFEIGHCLIQVGMKFTAGL